MSDCPPPLCSTKGKEVNPNISGKDSTSSLFTSGGGGGAGSDGGSSSSSDSSDIDGMDSDDGGDSVTSRGGQEAASKYVSFQVSQWRHMAAGETIFN